jgi:hypothetical protein
VDIDDDQQIENHKKGIEEQLLAASTASIIAEKFKLFKFI